MEQNSAILIPIVVRRVFELDGGGGEQQAHANEQKDDGSAREPRS